MLHLIRLSLFTNGLHVDNVRHIGACEYMVIAPDAFFETESNEQIAELGKLDIRVSAASENAFSDFCVLAHVTIPDCVCR